MIAGWRRLRDAGLLHGRQPGQAIGQPSKKPAGVALLRCKLGKTRQRLDRTDAALEIRGRARAFLQDISDSADAQIKHKER